MTEDTTKAKRVKTANDNFDIRPGMPVYNTSGLKIGSVVEIAGFGNTRLEEVDATDLDGSVTEARTGTGYIKMQRDTNMGAKLEVVPFSQIESVASGDRVVLIGEQADPASRPSVVPPSSAPATRGSWLKRLFGGK